MTAAPIVISGYGAIPDITQERRSAQTATATPQKGPKKKDAINTGRFSIVRRRGLDVNMLFAAIASTTQAAARIAEQVSLITL